MGYVYADSHRAFVQKAEEVGVFLDPTRNEQLSLVVSDPTPLGFHVSKAVKDGDTPILHDSGSQRRADYRGHVGWNYR